MSNIEQIDFSTLIWVKKELDETLNRAKSAIEEYVENPEDENQLQFCATYLHQVQGTLKMVELYGAAMVAEEMEQVAKKILDKEIDSENDAFEVLMRGIILLPDYLERIQLGHKDIPMVLLPLVNDLRTVKGDCLLSESALFNPDLSLGLPQSKLTTNFSLSPSQLGQVVKKIRSAYQICLLKWLKGVDVESNLKKIQIIVDKLKTVLSNKEEKQLFWVAGGLFEALISGGLKNSVTIKQLSARLDQAIRMITVPESNEERPYRKLTKNLLYYVALADSNDRRINEIQTFFNLSSYISDDVEIKNAQSSLSGKNRELLESVTSVIKEDLMEIQDKLDLYSRNDQATSEDLGVISKALKKIADTLGILGIGVARSKIISITEKLNEHVKSDSLIDHDTVMHVAEVLIYVESSLDDNIASLGEAKEINVEDDDSLLPSSEIKKIVDTLAKESINNLQKIKQNFVMYIESPWNKENVERIPKLLREISGALKMSGFDEVSTEIDKIELYTTKYMLESDYKPSIDQLDMLAESVASLEYYLEYLSNGTKGEQRILDLAKSNIDALFVSVEETNKAKKDIEEIDADLDQMTDDDFGIDLEDGIDIDLNVEDSDMDLELDLENVDVIIEQNVTGIRNDIDSDDKLESTEVDLIVKFSEETDDDIKEVFLEEFEEELEHLNSIYPRWKKSPDEQVELLGEIRRIFHTLKGSGRLVGALAIGDFSWKFEEMINMVLNNSQEVSESYLHVMQQSVEILPGLLEALKTEGKVPAGYHQLLDAADKVVSGEEVEMVDYASIEVKSIELPESITPIDMDEIVEPTEIEIIEESDNADYQIEIDAIEAIEESDSAEYEIDTEAIEKSGKLREETEVIEESGVLDQQAEIEILNTIDKQTEVDVTEVQDVIELNSKINVEELDKTDFVDITEKPEENVAATNLKDVMSEGVDKQSEDLSVDPIFVEILQQEVGGHLEDVDKFISHAKANNDNKSTEEFVRIIHTLNGAANMASVDSIVEMTTPLESIAKLSKEINVEFDVNTIDKITQFKDESLEIMKDLANNSETNVKSQKIGAFFKEKFNELEIKSKKLEAINTDESIMDFDLSEFLDGSDETDSNEAPTDEVVVYDLTDSRDMDKENLSETSIDEVDEIISLEDIDFDDIDEEFNDYQEIELTEADENIITEEKTDELDERNVDIDHDDITDENLKEVPEEIIGNDLEGVQEEEKVLDKSFKAPIIPTSYGEEDEKDEHLQELDEELLEIFQEEADDILDRTEHVLSDLEENPNDSSLILALQRDLHTLKGGARMAGIENMGDLSHIIESLLEVIGEEKRKVDINTLSVIQESFDMLNEMKNEKDYGQSIDATSIIDKLKQAVGGIDSAIPEESKLDQDYLKPVDPLSTEDESIEPEELNQEVSKIQKKSNVLSGNQIKVNSELLDNLVNYAGEVSIYRSRLEQEVGSFRINLSELGNTVARIKEQLRKLDVETEAQIMSTFQTDNEDETFDPLEMDRFSQLQQLSRSLAESVSDLTSIHSYLDDVARTSDNLLAQQSRVNTELQEGLMETRLVSFNSIVPRLRRLVRTTAKELSKPVKLDVRGAEGEMDKTVLEGVIAPLEHMLRNALAHGIEANRETLNKPNQGSIIIDIRREATEVVITISDDGAGINRQKVKELAIKKGMLKKGMRISDENIDRLILHSGFSTVEEISKLAGRGVGMDVVSNQINILGGSLDINSVPNVGTKFIIRLPYTLALSSALLVEISETVYAVPISGLEGIIRMPYEDYQQKIADEKHIYEYANDSYRLQELNKLLDIDSEIIIENNQIPLVMIRSGDEGVALRVDRILGSREIVVKTVGTQISSVSGIYGATILGDGNVVLILDVIPLSRTYIKRLENLDESLLNMGQEEIEKDPVIMIVDDSITMRKVGERILRRNNYDVLTAKDGLDALENLKDVIPDVMLLDIEMPRMDGYELAIEMKKDEKYANIPIIMITSRTGEKHRQKAIDLGVDRYLGKPYQEADLLANISELIEQQN